MAPRTVTEYGSIQVKPEDEEVAPLMVNGQGKPLEETKRCPMNKRYIATGVFLAAFLVYMAIPHGPHQVLPQDGKNGHKGSSSSSTSISTNFPPLSITKPHTYLQSTGRASDATPSSIWGPKFNGSALPTNSWYLNLVSHRAAHQPDEATRAYTVPYIIDTAAANKLAGIRVHWPVMQASGKNIQMVDDEKNGLSFGTADSDIINAHYQVDQEQDLSLLGVSLRWSSDKDQKNSMLTHIVR